MVFFLGLLVVTVVHAWLAIKEQRQMRQLTRVVRRVDRMLTIWAEHWGESPETVRPLLQDALGSRDECQAR